MSERFEEAGWPEAYVDGFREIAGMLMGISRRGERAKACLKVLIAAATSLTSRAPSAIAAPSGEHSIALAQIAGAAAAAHGVITHGKPNLNLTVTASFLDSVARQSAWWGGMWAPGLMAATDGEMRTLLYEGAVPALEAGIQAGRPVDAAWLVQPAFKIEHAAVFLAELNAVARVCPAAVHQAHAEALDQQIAGAHPVESSHIRAHAFAVHHLTGIYGPGDAGLRRTMLDFVATHPPPERATLQASKVAALLSDGQGPRAKMALLDHIIIMLGPTDRDPSIRNAIARDCALVLLLLDTDAAEPDRLTRSAMPVTESPRGAVIDEITREVEGVIATADAESKARNKRAAEAGSLAGALAVVSDAAAEGDHEQAWSLLRDIARQHAQADPHDLVTVAPDVLGSVPLESDGQFDGPGAGCFTVLSPAPADAAAAVARVAARLLNVDDRGIEHSDSEIARTAGAYTPNYLHDLEWCDRGAQVMLDTKASMSAPMARAMIAIITRALIDDHVPALVTGWIPALGPRLTPWHPDD